MLRRNIVAITTLFYGLRVVRNRYTVAHNDAFS
jgi:hypothetical protein